MISWRDLSLREVTFSYVSPEGDVMHLAVERMEKMAKLSGMEPFIVPISPDFAEHVRTHNGIEFHRLDRLEPAHMCTPVIYIETDPPAGPGLPPTCVLVDGSHRYLKAHMLGWVEIPAYVFPLGTWEQFVIDIPVEYDIHFKEQTLKEVAGGYTHWSGIA